MTVGDSVFRVRNFVDKPGEFTVISPNVDRKARQIRQLVDYLVSVLGGEKMFFYDARGKMYRELDLETLEFKTGENTAISSHPETMLVTKLIAQPERIFAPVRRWNGRELKDTPRTDIQTVRNVPERPGRIIRPNL
jgi:hypothetical protein